jgi:hypothetical protein
VSLLHRLPGSAGRTLGVDPLGGSARRERFGADLATAGGAIGWVLLAWVVGRWLTAHGADVHAPTPPLYAGFEPRIGPGTPFAVVVGVLVVIGGPSVAGRLSWRWLLLAGYLTALAWTFSLALIDGWRVGIAGRLAVPTEYLREVPLVTDVGAFLRTFSSHILAFQPGSFTTHVAAHPPLAVLVFVGLDRIGLGGGGPAGVLCILVGASVPVTVAITLRALAGPAGERLARAALPFAVLAPTAIWVGVSADGMYAGVLAAAVCALATATRNNPAAWKVAFRTFNVRKATFMTVRLDASAVVGVGAGVLFGCCLYFSYGLALAGVFPLAVLVLTRRFGPLAWAAVGVVAVVGAFAAAGFWWVTGYEMTRALYAQPLQLGSADRAYGYWVWAAPAAFAVSLGPATVAGVRRTLAGAPRVARRFREVAADRRVVTALVGAALLAVLVADLSGLSRGETERIWLPFASWLLPAAGLLPARHARYWLAAQALVALAVNHLLDPPW